MSRGRDLSLTITVLGSASRPLTRAGVRAGDVLFVTGRLGGPRAAVRAWMAGSTPRAEHRARFVAPRPRLAEARWLADAGCHAAIDISDGLLADAAHLAAASGVRIELGLAAVPMVKGVTVDEAMSGGEEYELLVAFAPSEAPDTELFERRFGVPLSRIGEASAGTGIALAGGTGAVSAQGHDHLG